MLRMNNKKWGIFLLLLSLSHTMAMSESNTMKGISIFLIVISRISCTAYTSSPGSCGGRLETNLTYAGRLVRSRRIGLQRNMEGGENATDCSQQCGHTDECQYWTFKSGAIWAPPCQLFTNLTQKDNGIGGQIYGRQPCSKNGSIIEDWYEC